MRTLKYLLVMFTVMFGTAQAEQATPEQVIEKATSGVIEHLNALSAEQRTDAAIRELVLTWIVPAIDETRIAMGALGKHWRSATNEQRHAFIERYRDLQIKTYSSAFKSFNGEKIVITDTVYNEKGDKAIVRGQLKQADNNTIPIDFRLYQKNADAPWQVYDAVVSGLSIVKTYRDQLNDRLQKITIDELLTELSAKASD